MPTPAPALTELADECEAEGLSASNAEKIAHHLAKLFAVREDEIGILRIEERNLVFCYPAKLHDVGKIPLNTSTSVAVRTANSRRPEIINNFAQIKHTSLFETVDLSGHGQAAPTGARPERRPQIIQKLMSAPVVGPSGALGVIQISRKGASASEAGPDFTSADLQRLVACAGSLVKCFK